MSDINLLPDELRDKEEKELQAVRRKPKRFSIEMSSPGRDTVHAPMKSARPSVLSRLFDRKTKPSDLAATVSDVARSKSDEPAARKTEQVVHIPKTSGSAASQSVGNRDSDSLSTTSAGASTTNEDSFVRAASFGTQGASQKSTPPSSGAEVKVIEHIKKTSGGGSPAQRLFKFFTFGKRNRKNVPPVSMTSGVSIDSDDSEKKSGRSQSRDQILDVNLIPEELNRHPELEVGSKVFSLVAASVAAVVVIVVSYFGLIGFQINVSNQAQDIEGQIKTLDDNIATLESGRVEAKNFQQYLNLIKGLLDKHIYWSAFFDQLTHYTTNEVYYSNFSMTGNDKLVITAAAQDYQAVAEQLVAFQQATDFIKEVKINSVTAVIDPKNGSYNGVNFVIDLTFLPNVFLKPLATVK